VSNRIEKTLAAQKIDAKLMVLAYLDREDQCKNGKNWHD
jgi:hypothetical protein